jgi:hypothetical protein
MSVGDGGGAGRAATCGVGAAVVEGIAEWEAAEDDGPPCSGGAQAINATENASAAELDGCWRMREVQATA